MGLGMTGTPWMSFHGNPTGWKHVVGVPWGCKGNAEMNMHFIIVLLVAKRFFQQYLLSPVPVTM